MTPATTLAQFDVLVFSKTNGYRHESIEAGVEALRKLGKENGFNVQASEDSTLFDQGVLNGVEVLVFLNTTGDIFSAGQEKAIKDFIQNGGGFVGIHSASDTEYEWEWYGKLVGRYFNGHPNIQEATLRVLDTTHQASAHLPLTWVRTDEWYNYKNPFPENLNVLLVIDETTYEGGTMGDFHPLAWHHEFDGGRAFYTGLGHTKESYGEENFLKHLLGAITWAAGE